MKGKILKMTNFLYEKVFYNFSGKIDHDCSLERGIGYYLEALVAVAPFCKNPLNVTLRGITNNEIDPSPDLLKRSVLPVLKRFILIDEGLDIRVERRGCLPHGGGQVKFQCPVRKSLRPLQWEDQGKIHRIRGKAFWKFLCENVQIDKKESKRRKFLDRHHSTQYGVYKMFVSRFFEKFP